MIRVTLLAIALPLLLGAAALPDDLILDMDNPVIDATVAGVPVRLRVELDAKNVVTLNAGFDRRLPVAFEPGGGVHVGREIVASVEARAPVVVYGRTMDAEIDVFERDCCRDVDGTVSPELLPYARVRFVRRGGAAGGRTLSWPLANNDGTGSFIRHKTAEAQLFVQFAPRERRAVTMAAGASVLAKLNGGGLTGKGRMMTAAFGIERPVRELTLARPALLAGFAVRELTVRVADFRGGFALPPDTDAEGEIIVTAARPTSQFAWTAVFLGGEQLDRCSEIVYRRRPRAISLTCDFG